MQRLWKTYRYQLMVLFCMALSGFLCFYAIGKDGYSNTYYAAAVKSMLSSFQNFFFVSFDPGGFVSVDKPPLGLWLQTLSAWIFGFKGWSLILPQALAAVFSVVIMFHLVQKSYGKMAGLISALVLAVTPIFVAISRTNNLDPTLVMVLLLAVWALTAAAQRGSFKLLMLALGLVGLGYNIKMLQAYLVLPAFYLVYLFTAPLRFGQKFRQLIGATLVLLVISLSWTMVVDLTPAEQRPYVGGSQTNSALQLALGYNGIQRILPNGGPGGVGGPGNPGRSNWKGGSSTDFNRPLPGMAGFNRDDDFQTDNLSNFALKNPPPGNPPQGSPPSALPGRMNANGAGGPGGVGENGRPSMFRIFNYQLGGQISWLIPIAFLGLLAALLRIWRKENPDSKAGARILILWSAWLAPMLIYFSIAGFFHRYYLVMLAPGIAALTGIGMVELWKAYQGKGWPSWLLSLALFGNGLWQGFLLARYPQWSRTLIPIVCGSSSAAALVLLGSKIFRTRNNYRFQRFFVGIGLLALLLAPTLWSLTPLMYGSETTLPYAGPELANRGPGRDGNQSGFMNQPGEIPKNSTLIKYLITHRQGEKYLVAVSDSHSAAPIILATGLPVMTVGGFSGQDQILTEAKLAQMVQAGAIRYFLLNGTGFGGGMGLTDWVRQQGTPVSDISSGVDFNGQLYDLKAVQP